MTTDGSDQVGRAAPRRSAASGEAPHVTTEGNSHQSRRFSRLSAELYRSSVAGFRRCDESCRTIAVVYAPPPEPRRVSSPASAATARSGAAGASARATSPTVSSRTLPSRVPHCSPPLPGVPGVLAPAPLPAAPARGCAASVDCCRPAGASTSSYAPAALPPLPPCAVQVGAAPAQREASPSSTAEGCRAAARTVSPCAVPHLAAAGCTTTAAGVDPFTACAGGLRLDPGAPG